MICAHIRYEGSIVTLWSGQSRLNFFGGTYYCRDRVPQRQASCCGLSKHRLLLFLQLFLTFYLFFHAHFLRASLRAVLRKLTSYGVMGLWSLGVMGLRGYGVKGLWGYGVTGLWSYGFSCTGRTTGLRGWSFRCEVAPPAGSFPPQLTHFLGASQGALALGQGHCARADTSCP